MNIKNKNGAIFRDWVHFVLLKRRDLNFGGSSTNTWELLHTLIHCPLVKKITSTPAVLCIQASSTR